MDLTRASALRSMHALMKKIVVTTLALVSSIALLLAQENGTFPGLKKAMDPETYARAGVSKLSPEERATLDAFLRDYVGKKQHDAAEVAATHAVDRAVKERKVEAPEVIESRIVGDFKGTGPRTFFHLANGQVWKPTDGDVQPHSAIPNPSVVIYRDVFGYKMFVEGASVIRVKRAD